MAEDINDFLIRFLLASGNFRLVKVSEKLHSEAV